MADTQRHQQQYQHRQQHQHRPEDEGSFYSESPTPVPNEYRPPPPTFQHQQQHQQATKVMSVVTPNPARRERSYDSQLQHRKQELSLLNSTLLSLSVDDDGGTLPSLGFNPPSPLSQPSESLFGDNRHDHNYNHNYNQQHPSAAEEEAEANTEKRTGTNNNNGATNSNSPSKTLSLARRRRKQQREHNFSTVSERSKQQQQQQQQHDQQQKQQLKQQQQQPSKRDDRKNPPVHEVFMSSNNDKDNNKDNININNNDSNKSEEEDDSGDKNYHDDYGSTIGGESDTFFECVEDRILANRARRTMQSDIPSSQTSSPDRSMFTLDLPPQFQNSNINNNNDEREGGSPGQERLENIQENMNIGSDDVVRVHESALNALQQLKEELVKSNQRNDLLTREREMWKEEEQHLRQQVTTLQTKDRQRDTDLKRLREDHERLRGDNETAEKHRNKLVEEKQKFEAQTRDSTRTIKEFRHRILAGDNRHKELKGQLDKLNDELEGALSAKGEMAAELARAQTERMELESKAETLRKQLSEASQERDQSTSDGLRIQEELRAERKMIQELRASSDSEIERLNSSLQKANEALHRLREELTPRVRSAIQNQQQQQQSTTNHQTFDGIQHASMMTAETAFGQPPTLDSAIADRMARLRDAAERAHLIRGHKRELARIKSDYDAKIRQLAIDHADALRKAAKQLDGRRKTELEALANTLNQQHESHLEEVEDEHQNCLSQLQKEYGRSQEDSEESLEEALTRIARVTQDHGREKGRRRALEKSVEDLQRKLRLQQTQLTASHGAELEKRRRHWESEKEVLLGNLQRDCNIAFDNRRRGIGIGTMGAAPPISTPAAVRGINNTNSNNVLNIDTTDTPRTMASQVQGNRHRPPTSSHHQQQQQRSQQQLLQPNSGPSPLSMNSAPFFPETKNNHSQHNSSHHLKVIAPAAVVGDTPVNHHHGDDNGNVPGTTGGGGATYIVPTPGQRSSFSPTVTTTFDELFTSTAFGSPSIISRSYSDIDSVLRETEELVQSIM